MEKQLIDWNHDTILLFDWNNMSKDVSGIFIIDGYSYVFAFKKEQVKILKEQAPYALDRRLWEELVEGGFILKESNYIDKAFI